MGMSEEQKSLLELLIKVKDFMDQNGITFYLFGGSCIGALRHKGFIPWDDDIDIIMDRDNYKKLIEASYNMPSDDFEFWSFEKSDDYFKAFGQFSSTTDTYCLRSRVFNRGLCMGTIIDVFVMDYVPSDRLEDYKKDLIMYEEVLGHYKLHRKEIANNKNEYYSLVEQEQVRGRRQVIEELQAKVEKYTVAESDILATRFWVKKFRYYKKEWFGEPRYCEFEGQMMPIPRCAEATLRQQYGYDWQYLPGEDNRKTHRFYIDHNLSSNNYVEDMEQFFDTSSINTVLEENKRCWVEMLDTQSRMDKVANQLLKKRLLLEYRNEIDSRDFANLKPLISGMAAFSGEDVDTTFSEEFLSAWLLWLIKQGYLADAIKLADSLVLNKKFYNTLDSDLPFIDVTKCDISCLNNLANLLNQVVLMESAWQDDRYDDIDAILNSIDSKLAMEIPSCIIGKSKCILHNNSTGHIQEIIKCCDDYLAYNSDNYDVMKVKADLLEAEGSHEEALTIYELVRKNSRNGVDLIEIADKEA